MRTSELKGESLDWAVGIAQGWVVYPEDSIEQGSIFHLDAEKAPFGPIMDVRNYHPTTNWAQGGPIIEREGITVGSNLFGDGYIANKGDLDDYGPTPLVAAMRCFVQSKLGDEIEVPDGITK